MELRLGGHCTNGRLSWLLRNCADVATVDLDGDLEGLTDQAWVDICANNKLEVQLREDTHKKEWFL